MSNEFVPGPWQTFSDMHGYPYVANKEGCIVAWVAPDACYEAFDTAELIAAAPDLISALERMESAFHLVLQGKPIRDADEVLAEAHVALAKAKGHSL